jgi:hypothetical protein
MKRFSVLSFAALALCINACEKHPAAELPPEHATEFGKYAEGHGHGAAGGGEHATEHAPAHAAAPAETHAKEAAPAAPAPAAEAKPGESPKFLPENK